MQEINNEKIVSIILIFTIFSILFFGARYVDTLKATISDNQVGINELTEGKRISIKNMRQLEIEFNALNNRYRNLTEDSQRTAEELRQTKITYTELKSRYGEIESINKQLGEDKLKLSNTITSLSTRTSESSININEIRTGLEKQSDYIRAIKNTVKQVETNNRME